MQEQNVDTIPSSRASKATNSASNGSWLAFAFVSRAFCCTETACDEELDGVVLLPDLLAYTAALTCIVTVTVSGG